MSTYTKEPIKERSNKKPLRHMPWVWFCGLWVLSLVIVASGAYALKHLLYYLAYSFS